MCRHFASQQLVRHEPDCLGVVGAVNTMAVSLHCAANKLCMPIKAYLSREHVRTRGAERSS